MSCHCRSGDARARSPRRRARARSPAKHDSVDVEITGGDDDEIGVAQDRDRAVDRRPTAWCRRRTTTRDRGMSQMTKWS
jgi:hypothetical protein